MSDSRNMSVKAYMTLPDGTEEVRRFGIPEGASTSFSYLEERVRDIFALGTSDFRINWQDSEGDHVLISSDEELFEAISECIMHQEQKFLRVYVSVSGTKPKKTEESSEKDGIHAGVVCDGCNGPVCGVRFKCKVCPDYDLCGPCNSKGIHKHHQFMKISDRPGIDITINADGFLNDVPLFSGCGKGRGRGFRRGPHHQHQNPHQQQQQQQQQQFFHPFFGGDNQGKGGDKPKPFQFSFNNAACGGIPMFGLGTGFMPPNLAGFMPPNPTGFAPPNPTGFPSPNPDIPFPGADKIAEEAGKFASHMASQHVADIMKGMWTAWSGNIEAHQKDQTSRSNAGEDTPMADDSQEKKNESTDNGAGVTEPKSKSTTTEKVSEKPRSEPEQEEVILVDTEESNRTPSGQNSPSVAEDWTLLNKEKEQSHESSQNSTPRETRSDSTDGSARQIYPNLPSAPVPAPSAPHSNPRVNSALEQMRGMGYSDEGGWLTRLLEMKDGDINKVLDILLVQKK